MTASIPYQPVFERNIFTIDISTSVSSSSIQITQVSGPTAQRLQNSATATSTWRAPDFDTDVSETMVFNVTATDSRGTSTTVVVTAEVRGFAGPGLPVAMFQPGLELLAGNRARVGTGLNQTWREVIGAVPVLPGSGTNPREFVFFGGEGPGFFSYRIDDQVLSSELFSESSFFEVGTLTFNLGGAAGSGSNFVLLDEREDRFRYFIQSDSSRPVLVAEAESFDIADPCFVSERVNTSQDFIWVGQRSAGLSLVRLEPLGGGRFNTAIIDRFGDTRSLCHILTTDHSDRIGPPASNDDSRLSDIITIDYESKEIVLFGDVGEDRTYEELAAIPIDTQTSADLSIVDVISFGSESLEPRYLFILMADNRTDGDHRIVLVAQDRADREIYQSVYPLGSGIPIALVTGAFVGERPGDQFTPDLVVLTRDSGSYVLEYTDGEFSSTPPTLGPPRFIDTGIGAASAVQADASDELDNSSGQALLVAYPEIGLVRLFRPHLEIAE